MFYVYLTENEYSSYRVDGIMVGETDPRPILDTFIQEATGGIVATWDQEVKCMGVFTAKYWSNVDKVQTARAGARAALITAGFKEVEAIEVWLG